MIEVQTNLKALEGVLDYSRNLKRRLTLWSLFLQDLNMKVIYCPGSANINVNDLSRQSWSMDKGVRVAVSCSGGHVAGLPQTTSSTI